MLINIPIESLEERYSAQWNEWVPHSFQAYDVPFLTVYPDTSYTRIESGEFLDVIGTHKFKLAQLQTLIQMVHSKQITDDVLFFHDLWFPGIEALFYIRDALGLKFKITGCLHAGTWDDWDYLTQKGMRRWAQDIEIGWLKGIDLVFVATHFHADLIHHKRFPDARVAVTGFPIHSLAKSPAKKENLVIFPHRLAPEKAPEEFDEAAAVLREEFPDWSFLKTKEAASSKQEYYALLAKAKIAVSTAKQETWGIAQQEAVLSGCIPVVPSRLSYTEMYPSKYQYSNLLDDLRYFIYHAESELASPTLAQLRLQIVRNGVEAVPAMISELRKRSWL